MASRTLSSLVAMSRMVSRASTCKIVAAGAAGLLSANFWRTTTRARATLGDTLLPSFPMCTTATRALHTPFPPFVYRTLAPLKFCALSVRACRVLLTSALRGRHACLHILDAAKRNVDAWSCASFSHRHPMLVV